MNHEFNKERRMKKLIVFLLVFAVMGLSFVSAGGQQDKDSKFLAVIMPSADHGFLGESIKHAENATKKLAEENGYSYQFRNNFV